VAPVLCEFLKEFAGDARAKLKEIFVKPFYRDRE
jgi:hypothetical protein